LLFPRANFEALSIRLSTRHARDVAAANQPPQLLSLSLSLPPSLSLSLSLSLSTVSVVFLFSLFTSLFSSLQSFIAGNVFGSDIKIAGEMRFGRAALSAIAIDRRRDRDMPLAPSKYAKRTLLRARYCCFSACWPSRRSLSRSLTPAAFIRSPIGARVLHS